MTFDSFFDALGNLDWLGVIAGTVAVMILGTLWYTPLFGKQWAAAHGWEMDNTPDPVKIASYGAVMFVYNIGLAFFVAEGFEHALVMGGIIIGALLVASFAYVSVIWARYPMGAFWIDAAFIIVATTVAMFVQGLFI